MDNLKMFDLNGDGEVDLGEIAMGIELTKDENELNADLEDYENDYEGDIEE